MAVPGSHDVPFQISVEVVGTLTLAKPPKTIARLRPSPTNAWELLGIDIGGLDTQEHTFNIE
tara:strand:+ start:385 stop:570 length:186 start_codon:yes stop_codon:yes gene_type:complete